MSRYRELEKLQQEGREKLPGVAVEWLAAVRRPLEALTMAAVSGAVSDEEFTAMVTALAERMPELLAEMNHTAIEEHFASGMNEAMAAGIAHRSSEVRLEAKMREMEITYYGGRGKGKKCGNSYISSDKECRVQIADEKWTGNAKEMQQRADAIIRTFPRLSHPATGLEMDFNRDGRDKALSAMRHRHEFQAAAKLREIFLDSEASEPEPDRRDRKSLESFVKFRAPVTVGKTDYQAEIVARKIAGKDVLKFYHFRLAPAQKSRK